MITIFCFSYAGGVASDVYMGWAKLLGADFNVVPVDYPGRGGRASETPAASSLELVEDAVDLVRRNLSPGDRWSIFGHSMGAMVAYEVARCLSREQSRSQLLAVFLSGRRPPGDKPTSRLASLDDEGLVQAAATWGGIPPEFVERPHLQPLIADKLRADLALSEHPDLDLPALACPIHVLSGTQDPLVDISQLPRWYKETTEPVAIHLYDGDHFYFRRVVNRVIGVIRSTLMTASDERDEIVAKLA